ncbi:MAG: preprotein translocase subunit SecG [Pseudomonadota bacterium]|nr:preprotein translocase subunit SecG [Pseudomonadota bacterium]
MQSVLLVVQFLIAVALIGVILVQRTAQDGGGLMGGGNTMGGLFTARGSANLLTRTTSVLALAFIVNSLILGYIAGSQHQGRSAIDQIAPIAPVSGTAPNEAGGTPSPAVPVDAAPSPPLAPSSSASPVTPSAVTSPTPPKAPAVPLAK